MGSPSGRRTKTNLRLTGSSPSAAVASPPLPINALLTPGLTLATTPLSLARFILSRMAFLAEHHLHAVHMGLAAAQRVSKVLGVTLLTESGGGAGSDENGASTSSSGSGGVTPTVIAALAQVRLGQLDQEKAAASAGSKSTLLPAAADHEPAITTADVNAIRDLALLQSPFCIDVCIATLHTLRHILTAALPHVWLEHVPPPASSSAAAAPAVDVTSAPISMAPLQLAPACASAAASAATTPSSSRGPSPSASTTSVPHAPPHTPVGASRLLQSPAAAAAAAAAQQQPTPSEAVVAAKPLTPIVDEEAAAAAAKPWTAVAHYAMTLLRAHLRRMTAAGVDPAALGVMPPQSANMEEDERERQQLSKQAGLRSSSVDDAASERLRLVFAASALASGDAASVLDSTSLLKLASAGHNLKQLAGALAADEAMLLGLNGPPTADGEAFSLVPLHRLLQLIVEEENSGVSGGRLTSGEDGLRSPKTLVFDGPQPPTAAALSTESSRSASGGIPISLQTAAGDAIDAGLNAFYPTAGQRRHLLASLVARGGTVEVQFRFPALAKASLPATAVSGTSATGAAAKPTDVKSPSPTNGNTPSSAAANGTAAPGSSTVVGKVRDLRFDRAMLLLQLEAESRGWKTEVVGSFGSYVHLLIRIPSAKQLMQQLSRQASSWSLRDGTAATAPNSPKLSSRPQSLKRQGSGSDKRSLSSLLTSAPAAAASPGDSPGVEFIENAIGQAFSRAGLGTWTVPSGTSDPPIRLKIERVPDFASPDRAFSEPAPLAGVVRVYPSAAGSFKAITAGVEALAAKYPLHSSSSGSSSSASAAAVSRTPATVAAAPKLPTSAATSSFGARSAAAFGV